jgi:colanic acid biosynthesis glycosyl transferase WcaI
MRILIHGINFSPELTGIGKYTGEMAEWLAPQGHDVRVVTAPPYYPQWQVADGFANAWSKSQLSALASSLHTSAATGKLVVYRCPLWVPAKPSGLKRILHLASFALSSLPVMLSQVLWRPQVVWVVQPALFCAPQALLVARLCGAKAWLHIQDYEVDAAFDLGLLKGSLHVVLWRLPSVG